MSKVNSVKNKLPLTSSFILVLVGIYLFLKVYFVKNAIFAIILFAVATLSMIFIIKLWQRFTPKYAPRIIYWTTSHKYVRKIIAGGSFSYFEYNEDKEKIKRFEPVSRFINLLIAFLGISTSFAKVTNFIPESPVDSIQSLVVWCLLLVLVPVILTPVIPIIWTMEDLGLKAWNRKSMENWRISVRYKKRFNAFITVGTVSAGLALTNETDFLANLLAFLNILLGGVIVLIYPVSVLTLLYYLLFRGKVDTEVKKLMDVVTAKTILQIVDPGTGVEKIKEESIAKGAKLSESESAAIDILEEVDEIETNDVSEEKLKFHQKLGQDTKKTLSKLSDNTFGRLNKTVKGFRRQKKKTTVKENSAKKEFKLGSATKDLWDHPEDEDQNNST